MRRFLLFLLFFYCADLVAQKASSELKLVSFSVAQSVFTLMKLPAVAL